MGTALIIIFVLAFHTYLGYPLLLWIVWRRKPHVVDVNYRPSVTLLVAAYNEITVIEAKIHNSLALNYPEELIEYIFASDGSDDGTTELIQRFERNRFKSVAIGTRGGKARALRMSMPSVTGDIVILSDANTMIASDAVQKLVRHFKDPTVGAVSGDVRIEKAIGGFGESEGMYYQIERFIQRHESETESIIGVDGALYAIRKDLFHLPDDNVILDDFVVSMNVVNSGNRVLYDPEALATENATPTISQEMRRKSRVVAGGYQALFRYSVFPIISRTWILFCFISHKLLRWTLPVLLLLAFIMNPIIVISNGWYGYKVLQFFQMIFYTLAITGWFKARDWKASLYSVPFYFTMVNIAGIWGFFRFITGSQKVTWKKAERMGATDYPSQK